MSGSILSFFNPYIYPMRYVLLIPSFTDEETEGTERLIQNNSN